jgi:NPCBM/NEW2 domain
VTDKATGADRKWHRHPAFIAIVAPVVTALLGAATTLYVGKTGQLPDALAPAPSTATVTATSAGPTTTVTQSPPSTSTEPASNTPIPNGAGESVSISELSSTGRYIEGPVDINGTSYADGVRAAIGGCQQAVSETWNLSRDYNKFVATVGITDTSDSDLRVQFRTYVDNTPAPAVTLRKGESRRLDVPLKRGLELRLEAVRLPGSSTSVCSGPGSAAWGDPTVSR